jgi:hypothetical protein
LQFSWTTPFVSTIQFKAHAQCAASISAQQTHSERLAHTPLISASIPQELSLQAVTADEQFDNSGLQTENVLFSDILSEELEGVRLEDDEDDDDIPLHVTIYNDNPTVKVIWELPVRNMTT